MTNQIALSIDLEFFEHTPAYRKAQGDMDREAVGKEGVSFLLDLFDRHEADATFYIVSNIADSYPDLLREIDDRHEIGSHTHTHRRLTTLSRESRREELVDSRQLLADITDTEVLGFRAPVFDRPPTHFEELEEAGYEYDSSIIPTRRIPGWYGGKFDRQKPGSVEDFGFEKSPLQEIPISVFPGLRFPISGAWTRLLGRFYFRKGIDLLSRQGLIPVLYFHPWEFVSLPKVEGVPQRVYWRTGDWLKETITSLLRADFEFVTMQSLLE